MGEQTCKDCGGDGGLLKFGGLFVCPTCDGTGVVTRTGPYRLADGTWSDGVDRRLRLVDRGAPGRWEVWQDSWGDWIVWLNTDGNIESFEFPTHAEAIAYAARMARTN